VPGALAGLHSGGVPQVPRAEPRSALGAGLGGARSRGSYLLFPLHRSTYAPPARPTRTRPPQVPGCGVNLAGGPQCDRRYRTCAQHRQVESLTLEGRRQRFCQQCGRFHELADFAGECCAGRAVLGWLRQGGP
jgi:hypothetical protein